MNGTASAARAGQTALSWATLAAAAPLAVVVVTYLSWRSRLPDPLPRQWWGGEVSTTFPLTWFALGAVAVATIGALTGGIGVLAARRWQLRRALVATGGSIGAFAANLWLLIVGLSLDHPDAVTVPEPTWQVASVVVLPVAWGALCFLACGTPSERSPATGRPAADLPRADLAPGGLAGWHETSFPGMIPPFVLAPLLILAVVLAIGVSVWAAVPLLLVMAVMLALMLVRLHVDGNGVRISFSPAGWPRITVPLSEIESAEATTVRPHEWGGTGYRIRPGARGIILQAGPGVRLTLSQDRYLVVNSRDPQAVAGLLNTLIDRSDR